MNDFKHDFFAEYANHLLNRITKPKFYLPKYKRGLKNCGGETNKRLPKPNNIL